MSAKNVISRIAKGKNKAYLEVDGKPFLYNAVQTWCQPGEDFEIYLEKAAEINYKILTIWLHWRCLEPKEGEYDWSWLDRMVDCAVHYNLRLDLVWGGSNFCGHLDYRFAPEWLMCDHKYHLKTSGGECMLMNGWDVGICHGVDSGNAQILEKEKQVVAAMFSHLADYDKSHRVVFFQAGNEVNLNDWTGNKKYEVLNYCNEIGGVVKASGYPVATRMNLWGKLNDPDVNLLSNIDCHGPDPYSPDIRIIRDIIRDKTRSDMPHVAENAAYPNTTSLMTAAFAEGGFYNIYMLAYDHIWNKPGLYDDGWTYIDVTHQVKDFNQALDKIGSFLAAAAPDELLEFNTETDYPVPDYRVRKYLGDRTIGMDCRGQKEAVGLVMRIGKSFYFIADNDTLFDMECMPAICQTGFINEEGIWTSCSDRAIEADEENRHRFRYNRGECICLRY